MKYAPVENESAFTHLPNSRADCRQTLAAFQQEPEKFPAHPWLRSHRWSVAVRGVVVGPQEHINMSFKSISIVAAAALALCAGAAQAATTNGFANGGFENPVNAGNPPGGAAFFAAGWLAAPTGNPAMLSNDAHTGLHSALLTVPSGFGGSTLFQNSVDHGGLPMLTAFNVGDTPMLEFYAKGDVSTTGNVLFALRYLDGIGNILSLNGGNHFFQGSINTSTWSKISFQAAAIPVGTKALFLEMNTAVGPLLDGRSNAVLIDDISLALVAAPVPEPESYAMMLAGLAAIGAMVRRRRQSV
jgi:PEP-CTERM motif